MAETIAKASKFAFLGVNEGHHRSLTTIQVRWLPPPKHWFKLNSNGSSLGNPSKAGGGGLVCNHHGEWVCGYSRAIGHTSSVATELWALRDGINLCVELNLPNVLIGIDAKLVVELLQKDEGSFNSNDTIMADCKAGLQKIQRTKVLHYYREANKCANALARRGALLSHDFVIFPSPLVMFPFCSA